MTKRALAQQILRGIQSQDFYDWHAEDFEDYVVGEEKCKSEEDILKDIEDLFNLDRFLRESSIDKS